jgi:hypothetical protein
MRRVAKGGGKIYAFLNCRSPGPRMVSVAAKRKEERRRIKRRGFIMSI